MCELLIKDFTVYTLSSEPGLLILVEETETTDHCNGSAD